MIYKFLQAILLSVISLALNAQTLQSWTWDSYKMKFKAPNNLVVEKSDATVWQAANKSMAMDIYPKTGQDLTYDGMKNAIISWADKNLVSYNQTNTDGTSQPIYLSNINGYWGCAIDGTKDGFPTSVLLLVDPDHPDINFYVWISYAREYYHDVVRIIRSFTPM